MFPRSSPARPPYGPVLTARLRPRWALPRRLRPFGLTLSVEMSYEAPICSSGNDAVSPPLTGRREDDGSADSASRMQEGVEATINGVGRSISERLDDSRGDAAKTLDGAADALHEKADRVSELGHGAEMMVGKAARYVRRH